LSGLILFNKPFQVLSQFTDTEGRATLAAYLDAPGYRAAGRLDYDSEGLLLLTDDGALQQQIARPGGNSWKSYWVQVEGTLTQPALAALRDGLQLNDGMTRPARAELIDPPTGLWEREPPIRRRRNDVTTWLDLSIREGRNRQVRRMTAAVGFPTLRLIRHRIGSWEVGGLAPGEHHKQRIHMPLSRRNRRR